MTFPTEQPKTPTSIGKIEIILVDRDGGSQRGYSYRITVVCDDGSEMVQKGDLEPHLTATELTQTGTFLDNIRTRATSQILPSTS